jgi:hypothetical protein
MPRQTLTKTVAPGPDPAAGVAVTETAEDVVNHSQFAWTGGELILVHNTHATTTWTYTLTSAPDERGRVKDITTQSIVAGAFHVIDPLSAAGWRQSDGNVYLTASDATVKFGVITTKGRAT